MAVILLRKYPEQVIVCSRCVSVYGNDEELWEGLVKEYIVDDIASGHVLYQIRYPVVPK